MGSRFGKPPNGRRRSPRKGATMAEMEIMNVAQELSADAKTAYCSIQGATAKERAAVFNASNNPEHKIADYINKTIMVKDVLAEQVELTDEESGEIQTAVRVVLIDTKGESYQAISTGIYSALKRAIQVFGAPTWDEGLPILVKQVAVGKGSMLTFDVDVSKL